MTRRARRIEGSGASSACRLRTFWDPRDAWQGTSEGDVQPTANCRARPLLCAGPQRPGGLAMPCRAFDIVYSRWPSPPSLSRPARCKRGRGASYVNCSANRQPVQGAVLNRNWRLLPWPLAPPDARSEKGSKARLGTAAREGASAPRPRPFPAPLPRSGVHRPERGGTSVALLFSPPTLQRPEGESTAPLLRLPQWLRSSSSCSCKRTY